METSDSKNLTESDEIGRRIYVIRGHRVILDNHLAVLYGVRPIRLREQVGRNRDRFPDNAVIGIIRMTSCFN